MNLKEEMKHEEKTEWRIEALDLDAYLSRIGYEGDRSPTAETLTDIQRAHVDHIPFENLDVVLGRGVSLDLGDIQRKLVHDHRGGYCFEQNHLLSAALERLGFGVKRLAGRVLADGSNLRTHMLMIVESEGKEWLTDAGFGATLLAPIPLEDGATSGQGDWEFRLVRDNAGSWTLGTRDEDGWLDLYTFTEEPQRPIDYVVYNHYTATHPDSHFLYEPRAVKITPEARFTLAGRTFVVKYPDGRSEKCDVSTDEAMQTLRDTFGLSLDADTDARLRKMLERDANDEIV